MNATDFRKLSTTTTEGFDISKLDKVYNDILVPKFKAYANNFKDNKIRITDNDYCNKTRSYMKNLFDGKFDLQSLIETEMQPYLLAKGFKVHIWSPSYSVEVSW
tara:strand:+ start:3700 stop:4011 length:312 start_codon:yes stop_codon:yes gene_type:complete